MADSMVSRPVVSWVARKESCLEMNWVVSSAPKKVDKMVATWDGRWAEEKVVSRVFDWAESLVGSKDVMKVE